MATTATEHPRFCHMVKPIKSYNNITNFEQQKKVMPHHISPTRIKFSIMGNYLDFGLKIAHRGNTGSHRGKI